MRKYKTKFCVKYYKLFRRFFRRNYLAKSYYVIGGCFHVCNAVNQLIQFSYSTVICCLQMLLINIRSKNKVFFWETNCFGSDLF